MGECPMCGNEQFNEPLGMWGMACGYCDTCWFFNENLSIATQKMWVRHYFLGSKVCLSPSGP